MRRLPRPLNGFLETRRFVVLLFALIFAIFVAPLLATAESVELWFEISIWTVLLAGLYAASNRRAALIAAGLLLIPTLYAWIGPDLLPETGDELLRLFSTAVCFLFTAVIVGDVLIRQDRVTRETLLGGINVFMLLGFAFMLFHAAVEFSNPDSYTIAGQSLLDHAQSGYGGRGFATFLYFSFTTLTTLGYGDIVPRSDAARLLTSGEALVGQLYIAIFIGRLVGLEAGARAARGNANQADLAESSRGETKPDL